MEQRRSLIPTLSPGTTPRSSEKTKNAEGRSGDFMSRHDKEKGVNVQVILRCRPYNEDELRVHAPQVISCNEQRREVSVYKTTSIKQIDRTFTFDRVFGPNSQQQDLYEQAITPIVNEVLDGFNCTIFAYGQTGTGKTYTMEGGGRKTKNGELPPDAGVIPRAVRQIFDTLEAQQAEYNMKVTFLELYNEEITDLLAADEFPKLNEDKSKKPIALMEDGKGGVLVRGLEEEIVCSANEIYTLLERGSAKRRTAETLLNKQSSRSHSIFSITIHIKEATPEGEELIKCGKLNLVDLAGSENISRSGAREGRAREAGEINKSLLTLGRVITSLVEHLGHIPYRDSKLTRLLRDSLGGKTKTCIIATVSPSVYCLEETLSTLDYAHRAKSIKNKPEVNQKMMKSALIKDLYGEISRLKQEVFAAREKNGIYLPRERFLQDEAEKKAMSEKIELLEAEMDCRDKKIEELQQLYNSQQQLSANLRKKLEATEDKLKNTEDALNELEEKQKELNCTLKEKEFIISSLLHSEKALVEQACGLRGELENTAMDVSGLFSKIERKEKIEIENKGLVQSFRTQLSQKLDVLHKTVDQSETEQQRQLKSMEEHMKSFVTCKTETTEDLRARVEKLRTLYRSGIKGLQDLAIALDENSDSTFGRLHSSITTHASTLEDLLGKAVIDAQALLGELQNALSNQESKMSSYVQQQKEAIQRTINSTRSISKVNTDFFEALEQHASTLGQFAAEMQRTHDKKLEELERKYQECSAKEETELLENFAKFLAASTARKSQLVHSSVQNLRESAASKTQELQQGMLKVRNDTSDAQKQWKQYMEEAESLCLEDNEAIESSHHYMKEMCQECFSKTTTAGTQWKNAQNSLEQLERKNVDTLGAIINGGREANKTVLSNFIDAATSTSKSVETGNTELLLSLDNTMKMDHEICRDMESNIASCANEFVELRSAHYTKVAEISTESDKYLQDEYMEDVPSCTTPRRRHIHLPSMSSIEQLRTPPFDELLQRFRESKMETHSKYGNGDLKQIAASELSSPQRDSRIPLTALN
eukprot:TRINITY_DN4937_c0_g1_i1.p1 TRINITY_DN4937_c0_g1~~TRINITY_DN4937_c0_g1_i1.p1  ORF type:complete len:1049 (+),score=167.40 TRINITY_DN4937_c0_g1_i1:454-3600(+)